MDTRLVDLAGLQSLLDVLIARGYTVIGPTVRQGAIVGAPIRAVADLPVGWGDEQEAGHYRLRRRDDDAVFGFASGAQSAKPVFFPAETLLWRGRRTSDGGLTVEPPDAPEGPVALIGVRSCDLAAVGIHDRVLLGRVPLGPGYTDGEYAARRADAFIVAVTCSDPGGTCFCASMGTGPRPAGSLGAAHDLLVTELLDDQGHRFVIEVASARGAEVLDDMGAAGAVVATADQVRAADEVATAAAGRMGRTLDTAGLKELLYASPDSPVWDDVASRCLTCTNCTAVCPTCFCTSIDDVTDLTGAEVGRRRVWDSCFNSDYSYIHGGTVRASARSRYRQWMTHKLAAWQDQIGTSGCVGCGRCITWCPAAIDITAEAAALRTAAAVSGTASAGDG